MHHYDNLITVSGEEYLQINTYGSKERVNTEVVSQTIQLDQLDLQTVTQLIDIIKK